MAVLLSPENLKRKVFTAAVIFYGLTAGYMRENSTTAKSTVRASVHGLVDKRMMENGEKFKMLLEKKGNSLILNEKYL